MNDLLTIHEGERTQSLAAAKGKTILEILVASGDSHLDAPCGGKGLCGKCRVRASGFLSPPDGHELRILSDAELHEGWRLACAARLEGEARLERPSHGAATIIAEGPALDFVPDPPLRRLCIELPPARLEEQLSDEARLLSAVEAALQAQAAPGNPRASVPRSLAFPAMASLAKAARGMGDGAAAALLDVVLWEGKIMSVAPARDARPCFGLGVDIGTTTVVAYLVDLETGGVPDRRSALNAQRDFGADVISRIAATMERDGGLEDLRSRIAAQLSGMAASLLDAAGASPEDLLCVAIAGNTTMLHLLGGIPPAAIASAPFTPAFTSRQSLGARDLGLDLPASCVAFLLPGISAYVGADIVSGIAALGMAERDECSLLLDIGTNGELALGGSCGILCCATAAGPAFEGAGLSMGMGGVAGAIDSVWIDGGHFAHSTIGGLPARGLCGSGVLDALAACLESGLVEDTGRIVDAQEAAALGPGFAALRTEVEGSPRIAIGGGVHLTQADVRSLQLAVAAIAAGIDVLLARAGKSAGEVDRVFLAGGFGSFLDVRSAVRAGLLMRELESKVVVAGNTSGAGAVGACLSRARLEACDAVRGLCTYVELSSEPAFNDAYIERMMFPGAT